MSHDSVKAHGSSFPLVMLSFNKDNMQLMQFCSKCHNMFNSKGHYAF